MPRHIAALAIALTVSLIAPIALVAPFPGPDREPSPTRPFQSDQLAAAHADWPASHTVR